MKIVLLMIMFAVVAIAQPMPRINREFAAFTTASTDSRVMSPSTGRKRLESDAIGCSGSIAPSTFGRRRAHFNHDPCGGTDAAAIVTDINSGA